MARSGSTPARETFHKFFESWLVEQDCLLQDLISATSSITGNDPEPDSTTLQPLVDRVIRHYELYYRAKSETAEQDVLAMLSPPWRSSLEEAFLWVGGWRPSMAFHLLYSKSGLQLESRLDELVRGLTTGDLGDLSPEQLSQVDDLHQRTIAKEREISNKLAKHQETAADSSMVELSHVVTEMLQNGVHENGTAVEDRVETAIASKEVGLEEILKRADELRLKTLKEIIGILRPSQAVHFLIAAAELHLRFHDWGKKRDAEARARARPNGSR